MRANADGNSKEDKNNNGLRDAAKAITTSRKRGTSTKASNINNRTARKKQVLEEQRIGENKYNRQLSESTHEGNHQQ